MGAPFEGVRVVEIAAWTFAPGADAILLSLVEKTDVVLTSYLAAQRRELRIDRDDLTAVNPRPV